MQLLSLALWLLVLYATLSTGLLPVQDKRLPGVIDHLGVCSFPRMDKEYNIQEGRLTKPSFWMEGAVRLGVYQTDSVLGV